MLASPSVLCYIVSGQSAPVDYRKVVLMEFDYIKFLMICDQDEFARRYALFYDACERAAEGRPVTAKMVALGQNIGYADNKRRYVLEAWGYTAEALWRLPWQWCKWLVRLDIKQVAEDWSDLDVDNLFQRWNMYDTVRNKQSFNSRHRSKREGRSGGGRGIALGSHKSDLRVSVYRRRGQPYHMEVQLMGKRLRSLISDTAEQRRLMTEADQMKFWTQLCVDGFYVGLIQATKSAGLNVLNLTDKIEPPNNGLFDDIPF